MHDGIYYSQDVDLFLLFYLVSNCNKPFNATNEIPSRILFLGNPFSTDFCLFTKGLSALQFLYCTITISRAKLLHRNLPATSLHCLGDVSFALAQASLLLSPAASSPDTLLTPVLFAAFGPPFPTI